MGFPALHSGEQVFFLGQTEVEEAETGFDLKLHGDLTVRRLSQAREQGSVKCSTLGVVLQGCCSLDRK